MKMLTIFATMFHLLLEHPTNGGHHFLILSLVDPTSLGRRMDGSSEQLNLDEKEN